MLDRHQSIYMSDVKETNYFVHGFEQISATYTANGSQALTHGKPHMHIDQAKKFNALFEGASVEQLLGEASPLYMLNHNVPERLLANNPDIRIIIVLRNPSDVAFSNFVHHVRDRGEAVTVDDMDALLDESRYSDPRMHVFSRHLHLPEYATHLPHWVDAFQPDRLHIEIYEELLADPNAALSRIVQFLGLPEPAPQQMLRAVNQSRMPRFARVHSFVLADSPAKWLARKLIPVKQRRRLRLVVESLNAGRKPLLKNTARTHLDERFDRDRRYVSSLLKRPIHVWEKRLATHSTSQITGERLT